MTQLRAPAIWLALVVVVSNPMSATASGRENARVLVYLEVLVPARTILVSTDLAGRQILLVNAEVPPATYSFLSLWLAKIRGHVGVAGVSPSPPPDGVKIPVNLQLRAATTEVIFLQWRPAAIDGDAEFHVPDIQTIGVRVPPVGSLAFVTSKSAGSVIMIDRLSSRAVGARWVDEDPRGIAYSRAEQTIYVALAGQDGIGVLDGLTLRVINVIPLQFGDDPTRLLMSTDRSSLFVLSPGSRTVTSLSIFSLQQQFRVPVGDGPRSFAQDPGSGFVYVACEEEGTVQIIDPGRGSVVSSLTLASAPVEVIVDQISRRLFVGGSIQRRIHFLDLAGDGERGDLNLCAPILGLAFNPKTQRLYAGIPRCETVAVARPELGIEFASLELAAAPGLMAFDHEYRQLLVVLPDDGAVAVCNPNRGLMEHRVEVGDHPFAVLIP
jgi:hypothetical protein